MYTICSILPIYGSCFFKQEERQEQFKLNIKLTGLYKKECSKLWTNIIKVA